MTELKTLKDLKLGIEVFATGKFTPESHKPTLSYRTGNDKVWNECHLKYYPAINIVELQQSAKEWIKELEKEESGQQVNGKPLVGEHIKYVKEWIKHFFNLEEEDGT